MNGHHGTFFNQSNRQLPGAQRQGRVVNLTPTRPIVLLDQSWSSGEQGIILAALQQLTDDKLTLNGLQVFSDFSGTGSSKKIGEKLLRGLQDPNTKVIIAPQQSSLIPDTKKSGSDILVEAAFASGQLATFAFFTLMTVQVPTPGKSSSEWPTQSYPRIDKDPGYIPLAHELVHAYRMLRSAVVSGSKTHEFEDPDGYRFSQTVSVEELTVVGIEGSYEVSENLIRKEQNLNANAAYCSPTIGLDMQGVRAISAPAGKPLPPTWWPNHPTP